jgi:hypothetical protein
MPSSAASGGRRAAEPTATACEHRGASRVENKLIESKRLRVGDVSGIRALRTPVILRWNHLGGTTESGTTEARLRERIAKLQGQKASYERNVAAEREKRAAEEKRERETEERQKTQNLVTRFMQQANDAFYAEKYKEAATFCDKVLELEPKNQDAAKLRDIALRPTQTELDRFRTDFKYWRGSSTRSTRERSDEALVPVVGLLNQGRQPRPDPFRVRARTSRDQRIWDIRTTPRSS